MYTADDSSYEVAFLTHALLLAAAVAQTTSSFEELPDWMRSALYDRYIDYFYRRQEGLWRSKAMEKLPMMKHSTGEYRHFSHFLLSSAGCINGLHAAGPCYFSLFILFRYAGVW